MSQGTPLPATPVPTKPTTTMPTPTISVTKAPVQVATMRPGPTPSLTQPTYAPRLVQANLAPSASSSWWKGVFTQTNIWLFICFVIVYVLIFTLMKVLLGESFSNATASLVIDCLVIVVLAIWIVTYFTTNPQTATTIYDPLGNFMIWLRNFFDVPSNFLFLSLVMIFMYLMFFVLQIPMGEHKPYSIRFIEILMWVFYVTDIFAVIFMFLFGFSMTDLILNPMIDGWYSMAVGNMPQQATTVVSPDGAVLVQGGAGPSATAAQVQVQGQVQAPGQASVQGPGQCVPPAPTTLPPQCTDKTIPYIVRDASGNIMNNMRDLRNEVCLNIAKQNATPTPTPTASPFSPNEEVFNVANNLYTYEQAQELCSSYGARLATYDEVEAAYVDGGEWCSYGWSADQMALFPTQKDTWKRLQQTKNHKNDCGRPGINGGYMDNTELQFGVNCYGTKPTTGPYVSAAKPPGVAGFPEDEKSAVHQQLRNTPVLISQFNRDKWSEFQR